MMRILPLALALLVLGALPAPVSEAQDALPVALFEMPDARGDVLPDGAPDPPAGRERPPTPVTDPADVVAVRLREDAVDRLVFEIEFAASPSADAGDRSFAVRFQFKIGPTTFTLEASDVYEGEALDERNGWICLVGQGGFCTHYQPTRTRFRYGEHQIDLIIPKADLLGRGDWRRDARPGANAFPASIFGAKLTGFTGFLGQGVPGAIAVRDSFPDPGVASPEYTLSEPSAEEFFSIRPVGAQDTFSPVSVIPADVTIIPVTFTNRLDRKRILAIDVQTLGAEAGFVIRALPNLELAAKATRTVSLIVNASETVAIGSTTEVLLSATSLAGGGERSAVRFPLLAIGVLTPSKNMLYAHSSGRDSIGPVPCQRPPVVGPPWPCRFWAEHWLSPSAQPESPGDAGEASDMQFFSALPGREEDWVLVLRTLGAQPRDVWFDTDRPAEFVTQIAARASVELTLDVRLRANGTDLAEARTTISVGTSPTAITVPLPLFPSQAHLASRNTRLALWITASTEDAAATANAPGGLSWIPKETRLTLPLAAAELVELGGPQGPVGLFAGNATNDFANPGRTKAFPVVLLNQANRNLTVQLTATANRTGWQATLKPAAAYTLRSGASLTIGVLVAVPMSARDGDSARVEVVAASTEFPDQPTKLRFLLTSITEVDVPDDAPSYRADAEALANVAATPAKKSPGAPVGSLLAFVAAVLLLRRRG